MIQAVESAKQNNQQYSTASGIIHLPVEYNIIKELARNLYKSLMSLDDDHNTKELEICTYKSAQDELVGQLRDPTQHYRVKFDKQRSDARDSYAILQNLF